MNAVRLLTLALLSGSLVESLVADELRAPPEWRDGAPSVYATHLKATDSSQDASTQRATADANTPGPVAMPVPALPVVQASHEAASAERTSHRHLAPPSDPLPIARAAGESDGRRGFGIPTETLYTVATALALVIGSFLIFVWALRKGSRQSGAGLPADVVSVLGQVQLGARHKAQLLRVGNKLLLVSATPTGVQALTEVTDPVEVDRLVGLCQQNNPHSATKAFEHVFRQLSGDSNLRGLVGGEAMPAAHTSAPGYRLPRGESAHG